MEPILIYTDSSFVDQGAIQTFEMDLAFGTDEQDFEISFSKPTLTGGELLYIDGTEYGGIIDAVIHSTETESTIYKGRTWHGMLAGKIVKPPSGSDYYTLSGDANTCIASLLTKVGLTSVLTARTTAAGISVNYQFDRFCNAYDGLLKMLSSANAILRIERHDGITELWAEARTTITDEADSDLMDFAITDSIRVPNHLVCAGEGELQNRVVVDLYADASGNVSQTQSLTGVDEIAVLYNYNNADSAELIAEGTKELQSYQQGGGADLQVNSKGDWHVGDKIQVRDNQSGTVITSVIGKKIVKVKNGVLTVDYEVGDATAQAYGGGASAETNLVTPIANGGTGATTAVGALANLGAFPKTGGIMSGSIDVKYTGINAKAPNNGIANNTWPQAVGVTDSNDLRTSFFGSSIYTSGLIATGIFSYNYDSDGEQVGSNYFQVVTAKDGTPSYSMRSASAFRNTIGIGGAYGSFLGASSTLSLTASAQKVPLKTFSGTNCSSSSNGIKISQAGTYLVWVSACMASGFTDGDLCHVVLYKNSSSANYEAAARVHGASPWVTLANGPFVVSCAVDDVLYVYAYNQTAARGTVASSSQANSCGLTILRIA